MIMLNRLSGSAFALNADLIERIDTTPDTVITLVDGKKYLVTDSVAEVVAAVRRHRAEVIALSTLLEVTVEPEPAPSHGGDQPPATVTPIVRAVD